MKILILTQVVDRNDSVLGFFHRWIIVFSKQFEHIYVICLRKGEYDLPDNVSVFSLGKEEGLSRARYILNFYRFLWKLRNEYKGVLVHMNPEYVFLGGIVWRLLKKKVALWYNHKKGSLYLRISHILPHKIFYTSSFAYSRRYSTSQMMPVGIDTDMFAKDDRIDRDKKSILSVGRVSEIKRVHELIKALRILHKQGISVKTSIYGDPVIGQEKYFEYVKTLAAHLMDEELVTFHGGVTYAKLPDIYNRHGIFVNLTPSGSLDKTIFEAMACGLPVVVCNESVKEMVSEIGFYECGNVEELVEQIKKSIELMDEDYERRSNALITFVEKEHSLSRLANELKETYK